MDVIILYILHNLKSGRGKLIDQYDTLRDYYYRYLKQRSRTKVFCKLLLALIHYGFKPEVVALRNKKDILQLSQMEMSSDLMLFEVIPFDRLWGMIGGVVK